MVIAVDDSTLSAPLAEGLYHELQQIRQQVEHEGRAIAAAWEPLLTRMHDHQDKKTPKLRALRAWPAIRPTGKS